MHVLIWLDDLMALLNYLLRPLQVIRYPSNSDFLNLVATRPCYSMIVDCPSNCVNSRAIGLCGSAESLCCPRVDI
jgi:hypothetical protein